MVDFLILYIILMTEVSEMQKHQIRQKHVTIRVHFRAFLIFGFCGGQLFPPPVEVLGMQGEQSFWMPFFVLVTRVLKSAYI